MGMVEDILAQLDQEIDGTISSLRTDLSRLRTGRASITMLDGIRVNYYGTPTPLNQCANLTVSDARMILVKPWERGLVGEIEKAIRQSDLGINPQNDGEVIRLPFPQLTEERRRDLVKSGKQRGEEAKIALRTHRRDANEMLKEVEKDKQITQDELKRALEKVQEHVDKGTQKIEDVLAVKEKEIMEI